MYTYLLILTISYMYMNIHPQRPLLPPTPNNKPFFPLLFFLSNVLWPSELNQNHLHDCGGGRISWWSKGNLSGYTTEEMILFTSAHVLLFLKKKKNAVLTKWDKKPNEKDNGAQQTN